MIEASEGDFEGWLRLMHLNREGVFKDDMICPSYSPIVAQVRNLLPQNFGRVDHLNSRVHTFLNNIKQGSKRVSFRRKGEKNPATATVYFIRNGDELETKRPKFFVKWLREEVLKPEEEEIPTENLRRNIL